MTQVIKAGDQWEELASNELWDSDHPPAPLTYKETSRESSEHGSGSNASTGEAAGRSGRGGFGSMLLSNDRDGDGKVTKEELPAEFQRVLAQGDKNTDGALDSEEIAALAESFRKRRENSAAESRDPIVYGVAANTDSIVVRTGTHLYVLRERQRSN